MEFGPGVFALAVPIKFTQGQVFLSIAVVGIASRIEAHFGQDDLVKAVTEAGDNLAHLL